MLALRRVLGAVLALLALTAPSLAHPLPDVIPLPTGFQPEGIAGGKGPRFFVGSIPTGAVFRGDLRTGGGRILVPGRVGRSAIGLEVDHRGRLFVAGGDTGKAWVYDVHDGVELAAYRLAPAGEPTFINDVVVTRHAAWFTDSFRAVLYRVPVGRGSLGGSSSVRELPLSGDFDLLDGFNTNGIETTPDRRQLIIVQSNTATLFTVHPRTGVADAIELTGGDAAFGDGLLRSGRTLYVVQNQLNRIAVVRLAVDGSSGVVVDHLTDPDLDVPTTVTAFAHALYAVNARFGVPSPETADYAVVRVES